MQGRLAVLACILLVPAAARALDITTCGTEVPHGKAGVLQIDLMDCPPTGAAVTLRKGASLKMNGHVIGSGSPGVLCEERCRVRGPGGIAGVAGDGISGAMPRMAVDDLDLHHNLDAGIRTDRAEGMVGARIRLKNVRLHDNGDAGVASLYGRVAGTDLEVRDNGSSGLTGLSAFKLHRATVQGNGYGGVIAIAGTGRLVHSLVTDNLTPFPGIALDIATSEAPTLVSSTCGRSLRVVNFVVNPGDQGWGVCRDD